MGRKQRNDADYFPHFADSGKTLFILKSKFGNNGYAFWFQLLEVLCKADNHFYDCNKEPDWQYLISRTGVDEITGTEILSLLANLGKIDPELWKDRVIWCENLVANLADVYKKRGRPLPIKPPVLRREGVISVPEKHDANMEAEISGAETPQSKVKYSIVDNKENNKRKYGEFQNVLLTDEEYQKLQQRFNQATEVLIERLSTYIASTGKQYKSHYATILSWKQRDDKEAKSAKTRLSRDLPRTYTPTDDYPD